MRTPRRRFNAASLLLLFNSILAADCAAQQSDLTRRDSSIARGVRTIIVSGRHAAQRWPQLRDVSPHLRAVYRARHWAPLWSVGSVPTPAARQVVEQLADIAARGLAPADYDAPRLVRLIAADSLNTPARVAEFDIMLSTAALRALTSLQFGRVRATDVHANLQFVHEPFDLPATLRALAATTDAAALFDEAEPPFLHYRLLTAALSRLRAAPPDSAPRTVRQRIAQIALTMERWRWLPHTIQSPPPIIVNIPSFRLHAFTTNTDHEADLISMNVLVGKAFDHKTPVFSSTLRYLIFSPYWDVPPSIATKELLPLAQRNRTYLARNNYEIVSQGGAVLGTSAAAVSAVWAGRARIRQRPGPGNALGGVKFIFPNSFNVYLHDTPTQSLFQNVRRDASHGCIRIAEPLRLAAFLLRDQITWDSTQIAAAMRRSTPLRVDLTAPVPVHIVYATVVARENGDVEYHPDIYGHDRRLARLLARGYPVR
jgi:murein L,D-transpeptidase YcbB/YkuD